MPQLVWLVTGCSSGFGLQFTHSILARGDLVIATARNPASIQHLSSLDGVSVLQLDVTSPQHEIDATIAHAVAIHGHIDVLINNAAHVQLGVWEELEYEDWTRQFETNVFGTIKVTKPVLSHMRTRNQGTLVFVSSLNGFVAHPTVGPYSASKHALEGAVESLSHEVAMMGSGVKTLLIEPGRFRTELLSSSNLKVKTAESTNPEYTKFYKEVFPAVSNESGRQPGDPVKLASIVLDLVRNEGIAEGKNVPLRILLGNDAWEEVGTKLRSTLKSFEEWEGVTRSTDFDA